MGTQGYCHCLAHVYSLWLLTLWPVLDVVLKVGVDDGVLVGAQYKRVALDGQGCIGSGSRGVDEGDDLETRSELVLQSEGVVPWSFV